MSLLKLQPGQRIPFKVVSVEAADSQYGPQAKFIGQTPDDPSAEILLKVETATKQLDRIGLTVLSVVGQRVEFEKVAKDGKQFINIHKSNGAPAPVAKSTGPHHTYEEAGAATAAAGYSGPTLPGEVDPRTVNDRLAKVFSLYDDCFDHVMGVVVPKLDAAQIGSSPESVGAITATLFIQACNKGLAA